MRLPRIVNPWPFRFLHATSLVAALAVACMPVPPSLSWAAGTPVSSASLAYQVDAAHAGAITFSTPFAPPLRQLWSLDLGGPVSYPVVNGKLVSVLVAASSGSQRLTALVTLNIANGKIVWKRTVGTGYNYGHMASEGGKLFVALENGPVQAFDAATGHPLWSTHLVVDSTSVPVAPVAAGGFLYAAIGEALYQIDEAKGAIVWKQFTDGGIGLTVGDGNVYMPVTCLATAVDTKTGNRVWHFDGGCEGGGAVTASFYNHRLYAPEVLFNFTGLTFIGSSGKLVDGFGGSIPAFDGASSYAISAQDQPTTERSLVATNVRTGNLRWAFTPKDDALFLPPIVINGNTYTLSNTGTLYINSGRTGLLLQKASIGVSGAVSSLALPIEEWTGLGAGSGTLIVPSGSVLAAFGPQ